MAKLPTRRALAQAIENLERDLKIATAGAAGGALLARSGTARSVALGAGRRLSPYALAVDALIREEESLLGRGAIGLGESASRLAAGVEARSRREGLPLFGRPAVTPKKRPKSKFNKMVSAGMKTVKASSSYGKKGTISNSKKAFKAVTTTASKILKGGKTAKSGITRKIGLAVRRFI